MSVDFDIESRHNIITPTTTNCHEVGKPIETINNYLKTNLFTVQQKRTPKTT